MIKLFQELFHYRELLVVLAWKNVIVRYKQAYLGLAWSVLKPVMLMLVFTVVRLFVGIDSGPIPYPVLTYAALIPWIFFQEATSEGVISVVGNAMLVRKIYFPREIFPITAVLTKLVELFINLLVLAALMAFYGIMPGFHALWLPVLVGYIVLVSLCVSLAGAAFNVYYRDISTMLPIVLSLIMYTTPVIYPIDLVKKTLLVDKVAGPWSEELFTVFTLNPLAGIIDAFQRTILHGQQPDYGIMLPGIILTLVFLPISYRFFRKAEQNFADVI